MCALKLKIDNRTKIATNVRTETVIEIKTKISNEIKPEIPIEIGIGIAIETTTETASTNTMVEMEMILLNKSEWKILSPVVKSRNHWHPHDLLFGSETNRVRLPLTCAFFLEFHVLLNLPCVHFVTVRKLREYVAIERKMKSTWWQGKRNSRRSDQRGGLRAIFYLIYCRNEQNCDKHAQYDLRASLRKTWITVEYNFTGSLATIIDHV